MLVVKTTIRLIVAVGLLMGCMAAAPDLAVRADGGRPQPKEGDGQSLPLLLKLTPKPDYGAAVPAKVSGRVVSPSQGRTAGVEGVSVTDGYSVVKTDANGHYTLILDPMAVFVYITRPARHDVIGDWYRPVATEVDFTLQPAAQDENDYTFVHVTDTHISTQQESLEGLSRFVREVNSLNPKPRFVLNSGDLVNLDKALNNPPDTGHVYFRNYAGIMNHLEMPFYNVAGDHSDSSYRIEGFPRGDHRCGKPMYWEYFGPHFFSFEYGKVHYVSVDYCYHLGKRQLHGNQYPTQGVQPMHVAWMQQDMARRTKDSLVVTTSEKDLCKYCPGFAEMAAQHDVRLQLIGDDHIVAYKAQPVPYRVGGALSGFWWNPKCGQLCPDLSPQGYMIYRVRGEEMDCFYKGLGQRVAIVSHRMGAPWEGSVTLLAHIVQPHPNETLLYGLDGKTWKEMKEVDRPYYRAVYEATVDSTSLADGLQTLAVKSSLTGEKCVQEIVVLNGRHPAAFRADGVLTLSTGKGDNAVVKPPVGKVNVVLNGQVVGVLAPGVSRSYALSIPAATLREANLLRFVFERDRDGMTIGSPVLACQENAFLDPRDQAIQKVKTQHWGAESVDWGGFIVGDGGLEEGPFLHKQDVFCFVLNTK